MAAVIKKEIIIIPNENNSENYPYYIESFDVTIDHDVKYKKYALENGIKLPNDCDTAYNCGVFLASEGFLNREMEGKNLICFIPSTISKNQYKWMKKNKYIISKYNISLAALIIDESVYKNSYMHNPDIIFELYELLKMRYNYTKESKNGTKTL